MERKRTSARLPVLALKPMLAAGLVFHAAAVVAVALVLAPPRPFVPVDIVEARLPVPIPAVAAAADAPLGNRSSA